MAFTDRVVEHPGRVRLTNVSGDIYDITPYEGEVTAQGTLLNAANLNQQTQLDSETAQGFSDAGAAMDKQNDMSGALAFLLEKNPETVTDGSWRYIKTGGLFIGVISFSGTLTITTATGSLFTSASPSNINLPSNAISTPLFASVNVYTNNYPLTTALRTFTSTALTYQPLSTLSRASSTYTIEALVIGIAR